MEKLFGSYEIASGTRVRTDCDVVDSDRGAEPRIFFLTFTFSDDNRDRIQSVLESFAAYCQPQKNVPFERYKLYSRIEEGVVKKGSEKLRREIPGNINLWEIQKTTLKGNSTYSTKGPIHQVTKLPSAPGPRFGLGPWRRNT